MTFQAQLLIMLQVSNIDKPFAGLILYVVNFSELTMLKTYFCPERGSHLQRATKSEHISDGFGFRIDNVTFASLNLLSCR